MGAPSHVFWPGASSLGRLFHRVATCCALFRPAASGSISWWCVCLRGTEPWRTCSGQHTQWVGAGSGWQQGPLVGGPPAWTACTRVVLSRRVSAARRLKVPAPVAQPHCNRPAPPARPSKHAGARLTHVYDNSVTHVVAGQGAHVWSGVVMAALYGKPLVQENWWVALQCTKTGGWLAETCQIGCNTLGVQEPVPNANSATTNPLPGS